MRSFIILTVNYLIIFLFCWASELCWRTPPLKTYHMSRSLSLFLSLSLSFSQRPVGQRRRHVVVMLYSYCGISVTVTLTFLVCLVEPMKSTFLPCESLCKFQCQTFSPLRLLFFRDSIFFY